jgi:hypothetical protein
VGSSLDAAGNLIANGATVITTPPYGVGSGQLKVFIDGVRQDGAYDYAETTGKDGANNWGKITFSGGGVATGEQLLLEVDGYVAYDVNAVSVIFTPNGTVTATNVQTAIQQIDTAKMPLAGGNFTGSVTMAGGTSIGLAAGTSSVAPLKFSAGTNLSSPQAGAIEFNGTNVFYTDSGNTRRTFASTDYVTSAISGYTYAGSVTSSQITTGLGYTPYNSTNPSGYISGITSTLVTNALGYTPYNSTNPSGYYSSGSAATFASVTVNGAITATGDITAFSSDGRLKENFRPITDAVSKVVSLNGVIYNWNALAHELAGYDRTVEIVGLIAQELEAVLPQAIKPAPFDTDANGNSKSGENYKTIQYEKVVPLLVEAIKEQQATIERQQAQIDMLISKLGV